MHSRATEVVALHDLRALAAVGMSLTLGASAAAEMRSASNNQPRLKQGSHGEAVFDERAVNAWLTMPMAAFALSGTITDHWSEERSRQ